MCLVLLPTLLPRVELGEAVADDGDGQPDDEDAEDGAEAAEDLPEASDWTDVSVAHLCKRSETEIAKSGSAGCLRRREIDLIFVNCLKV